MAKATPIPTNAPPPETTIEQPPAPLPKIVASPIPQVEDVISPETGLDACQVPPDDEFTDGVFVDSDTGEEFALCIHPKDGYGNTHSLKNSKRFWQGTVEKFNAKFKRP